MNNLYDLHSWSKEYRRETLLDARKTHLERQLREERKARSGRGSVGLALASMVSQVRGVATALAIAGRRG